MSSENVFTSNWIIENFTMFVCAVQSPNFSVDKLKKERRNWRFSLCPVYDEDSCMVLCIVRDDDEPNVIFDIAIDVILPDGEKLSSIKKRRQQFSEDEDMSNFLSIPVTQQQLVTEMNKSIEDHIIIRCQIFTENPEPDVALKTKISFNQFCFEFPLCREVIDLNWKKTHKYNLIGKSSVEITVSTPDENVSIELKVLNSTLENIKARISLFDFHHTKLKSKLSSVRFRDGARLWRFSNFLKSNELCAPYLVFEFFVPNGIEENLTIHNMIPNRKESPLSDMTSLRSDFLAMYDREEYPDMELKTDERTFKVHRNILSARSPVFSTMLKQNMVENKTGVVDIEDVEADTLSDFLEFLYTGSVHQEDYNKALKLLVVADKYQVSSLKEKCSEYLLDNISCENAMEVLYISDLLRLLSLKESAIEYLVMHAKKIISSEEWQQWSKANSLLAVEIIPRLVTYIPSTEDSERRNRS